jgi:hypothetical protein
VTGDSARSLAPSNPAVALLRSTGTNAPERSGYWLLCHEYCARLEDTVPRGYCARLKVEKLPAQRASKRGDTSKRARLIAEEFPSRRARLVPGGTSARRRSAVPASEATPGRARDLRGPWGGGEAEVFMAQRPPHDAADALQPAAGRGMARRIVCGSGRDMRVSLCRTASAVRRGSRGVAHSARCVLPEVPEQGEA